ncbi:MAG: alpha-glucan family phosphorylase [Sedimentisphaerales bacterium]|nr:alpha-glucan family phosphorylase [Sedimentisphaerales bacterium]
MAFRNLFVYPKYPENLTRLYQLAYNLWCTWNYEAINLWYRIDAKKFREVHHNPVRLLLGLQADRIEELSKDRGFLFELDKVWQKYQDYITYRSRPDRPDGTKLAQDDLIAYFSMEFGLHECIPIYGGGLGILAGDFLKAASDLGMPMVGIGLVYRYGYFTQKINLNGMQEELFVEFDNHLVPMREVRDQAGQPMYIQVELLGQPLVIKLWEVQVGQTRLILMDTDIDQNPLELRSITDELYVADKEKRLQQEFVLGIGGAKALSALGIRPKIYHINEGHSAFLIVARLEELIKQQNLSFVEAKALIRASTVFTTHTPVIAGNENFQTTLVRKYIEPELARIGLSFEEFARHAYVGDSKEIFWLPALAIRFARYVNAVSELHCEVSRRMWAGLFPGLPTNEVPIEYVTNGVHSSWLSASFTDLLNRHIGPDYIHQAGTKDLWDKINQIPDEQIWEAHRRNKHSLVTFVREKVMKDMADRGFITSRTLKLSRLLNPDYLTIVFARRFAPYKRPNLLLKDKERLKRILTDRERPVQLIFAGKAHPADTFGKNMIKEIIDFTKAYGLEDRVIFLENYDIDVARHLVWGADVWLNTPIRELEASGTSGMKAGINGVLNLSVLDGWWPEVYDGTNGWAITAGELYKHSEFKERAEATQIYDLLEQEIIELYYDRNEEGIPEKWVAMMKASISSIFRFVNMNRVLLDYQDKFYVPALQYMQALSSDDYRQLRQAIQQRQAIISAWEKIRFIEFKTDADQASRLIEGQSLRTWCLVDLDQAPAELIRVELYYGFQDDRFTLIPMALVERNGNIGRFEATIQISGYGKQQINARIRPADPILQDLHPELIKWAS